MYTNEQPNEDVYKRQALMGSGNYTFGTSPTFLTPASCALLDACEVFSGTPAQQFYEGRPEVEVKDVAISCKGDQILVSGNYTSRCV